MLLLRQPGPDQIQRFLKDQAQLDFNYDSIGCTSSEPPTDYVVDHTRVRLGSGEVVFEAAKSALENWQQFQLDWLIAWPNCTPIRKGEVVAVLARSIGLWWLNACRIVYVIDEDERKKFGFAYGTLPDHASFGEERFLVEMDDNESVCYRERSIATQDGLNCG